MSSQSTLILLDDIENGLIPEHYRVVTTRLGAVIEVATENSYLDEVKLPDTDSSVTPLHPRRWFTSDVDMNEVMQPFFKAVLERYMPKTIRIYEQQIQRFVCRYEQDHDVNSALLDTIMECKEKGDKDISPIRMLLRWLIAYEFEGLDFDIADDILRLEYGGGRNQYMALYSLDAENGPFTREELRILQAATKNPEIHLEDRVVLKLCLEFGLRPVQIALLKQKDFTVDDQLGLAYLKIPRVKQKHQFRRVEFTTRIISDELSEMLTALFRLHRAVFGRKQSKLNYVPDEAPVVMHRFSFWQKDSVVNPYVLSNVDTPIKLRRAFKALWGRYLQTKNSKKHRDLFIKANWADTTLHVIPIQINRRLTSIIKHLPLSPRTGRKFQLNAYRFRYTLGTNAVTEGMTEIEVADLLDHSHLGSVKHYFHYAQEMFEILESATLDRVENKFFTAAWSKTPLKGNIYDVDVVEPNTAITIGKCGKGSPCHLEPAVACYGCGSFLPNKDVEGHETALVSLKTRAEEAHACSTREVAHQFDEAIAGCIAAVEYASGNTVYSIQDENDRIALLELEDEA